MGEINQRRQEADKGLPEIEIKALSGLSLKIDQPNQPNNVFKQLQNCDLYIPGSIRKVRPPIPYGQPLAGGNTYLNFVNYWAQPNKATGPINRVLAITRSGVVIDVVTGVIYVDFSSYVTTPIQVVPYMEVFPLYFNPFNVRTWQPGTTYSTTDCVMKYGSYDGKFYIYAPAALGASGSVEPPWQPLGQNSPDNTITWVNQGEVQSERFQENALVWTIPGYPSFFMVEYQYNPNSTTEVPSYFFRYVGIAPPEVPIEVVPVTIAPNLDGYSPVAGRGFVYTLYDPHTFHESSPSPFAGPTQINDITSGVSLKHTVRGSLLPPLPTGTGNSPYLSYQSYYLAIPQYIATAALGANYASIFFYATKDGGATFYRIPTLLDNLGNVISNSDGSVPIPTLLALQNTNGWEDLFPLPTAMFMQNSCRVYEGSGPINLVPDPVNLGPQSWSQANAEDIVVVPGDGQPPPTGLGNPNAIWAAGELVSTGVAGGTGATAPMKKSTLRSNKIAVTPGATYWFTAFADATNLTDGEVPGPTDGIEWDIIAGDFSNQNSPYLQLIWGFGVNGFMSGTFTSTHPNVRIRMYANHVATVDVGDIITWSTPFMYPGSGPPGVPTNYPTPDDSLIIPAPAALSQQPPPTFIQMAMYAGSIFGIEEGTFRIWYSNTGDFQSYGINAYLPLTDSAGVPVLELKKVYNSLLIGKQASMSGVAGSTPPFSQATIDPDHGVQSARSSIGFGSGFVTLLSTGLTMITLGSQLLQVSTSVNAVATGFMPERVIGDPIKPYTDNIITSSLRSLISYCPCPAVDTTRNFFLFSFEYAPTDVEKLVIASMSHQGPSQWSELVPPLPPQAGAGQSSTVINQIKEVIDPVSGAILLLATGMGPITTQANWVWSMFGGTQDGTLTAIAETWPLPDLTQLPPPFRDSIKIFHELWVEGVDIANWTYQWSTDLGETYSAPMQLRVRNKINVNARQISFMFTHAVPSSNPQLDPLLSYMKITYSERRQASGQNGY